MDATNSISIVLNGDAREIPAGMTVAGLLEHLGITPERVAIELNRSIVRKPEWPSTPVNAGAQLEVVQFVGGG